MQTSVPLGRIAGIELGINWSWLIAAVLIVWTLAAAVFPESNPGLSDGAYAAMGIVAAALFFAALVLHELGHALQARRDGVEIDGITLWVFGGVARFKGQFPSAGAELRIAVAGPAVTLALVVLFLAIALLVPLPASVDAVVYWLGYINVVLLVFNLLPALPLDGGRVVRALLWARRGDFAEATRTAATLGRLMGQALIGFGLVILILGGVFGGIWIAFIGWFILMAADSEAGAAVARGALEQVRVRDAMVERPVTAAPDMTLTEFMDGVFFPHRHTAYPVTEDGRALGLISFRDVLQLPERERRDVRVRERMLPTEGALVVDPDAALADVLPELMQTAPRRALVCEHGRLVGLLSITDAARILEARAPGGDGRRAVLIGGHGSSPAG